MQKCTRCARLAGVVALICAVVLSTAGCFGPTKNREEDFSDTLGVDLADIFEFTVQKNGETTATITALSNPNAILGMWMGQLVGGNCLPILGMHAPTAVLNRTAINAPINKGTYCLQVYDPGTLKAIGPVTYTVRVSHP